MIFFLGIHNVAWISQLTVPFMISRNRLVMRMSEPFPRALVPWTLDSGGFTEVTEHGGWRVSVKDFIGQVRFFSDEIGKLLWASPQDWMVEEVAICRTGLSVKEHQRRTVDNFLELMSHERHGIPFIPVIQGQVLGDYLRHVEMYLKSGIDLTLEPLVGVGSMCRRGPLVGEEGGAHILERLHDDVGLKMHAYGYKLQGLLKSCTYLHSSDSLAWSKTASHPSTPPHKRWIPGHEKLHKHCGNCLEMGLRWRKEMLAQLPPYCVETEIPKKYGPWDLLKNTPVLTRREQTPLQLKKTVADAVRRAENILRINLQLDLNEREQAWGENLDPDETPSTYRLVPGENERLFMKLAMRKVENDLHRKTLSEVLELPEDGDDVGGYATWREKHPVWISHDDRIPPLPESDD